MDTSVLAVSLGALVCVCAVCWRALRSVEMIAGTSRRADDRWRRDQDSLVMRLVEKIIPYHPETLATHAKERMLQAKLDAQTEISADDAPISPSQGIPIESLYTTEEHAGVS